MTSDVRAHGVLGVMSSPVAGTLFGEACDHRCWQRMLRVEDFDNMIVDWCMRVSEGTEVRTVLEISEPFDVSGRSASVPNVPCLPPRRRHSRLIPCSTTFGLRVPQPFVLALCCATLTATVFPSLPPSSYRPECLSQLERMTSLEHPRAHGSNLPFRVPEPLRARAKCSPANHSLGCEDSVRNHAQNVTEPHGTQQAKVVDEVSGKLEVARPCWWITTSLLAAFVSGEVPTHETAGKNAPQQLGPTTLEFGYLHGNERDSWSEHAQRRCSHAPQRIRRRRGMCWNHAPTDTLMTHCT